MHIKCASVLFLLACAVPYGQAAPAVLIYSDQSPGALPHAYVWQQVVESQSGTVKFVTESSEFVTNLDEGPWSEVIVVARYQDGDPAYGEALRTYAQGDPNIPIRIFWWNDKGTNPTSDTAVEATMSVFLWDHGMTTVCYVNAGPATDLEFRRTHCVPGLVFPDFDGIDIETPEVIARAPAELIQRYSTHTGALIAFMFLLGECLPGCANVYNNRLNLCDSDRESQVDDCHELYGPSEGDPGDPDQLATCIAEANTDHTNCVKAAVHRYNNCVKLCPQDE
jgi:hypothetical protein